LSRIKDKSLINEGIDDAVNAIEEIIKNGIDTAMNKYN
jgi:peptidyl-tRNA hydrolase